MTILQDKIREFNIPVVSSRDPVADPEEFISFVRSLEDEEGFVVCWHTGHRVKVKAESYMRKHKAKDMIGREKNVIEIIVNEKADDVKGFLDANDLARFEKFEADFWAGVQVTVGTLQALRNQCRAVDRKTYAVEFVQKRDPKYSRFLYTMINPMSNTEVLEMIRDTIAKSCGTQTKVDECRWLFNCGWYEKNIEE